MQDGAVQASADFIINRTNWGINYRGQADDLIEESVRLIFDVTAAPEQALTRAGAQAAGDDTMD
jgi:hypothetical protein